MLHTGQSCRAEAILYRRSRAAAQLRRGMVRHPVDQGTATRERLLVRLRPPRFSFRLLDAFAWLPPGCGCAPQEGLRGDRKSVV